MAQKVPFGGADQRPDQAKITLNRPQGHPMKQSQQKLVGWDDLLKFGNEIKEIERSRAPGSAANATCRISSLDHLATAPLAAQAQDPADGNPAQATATVTPLFGKGSGGGKPER